VAAPQSDLDGLNIAAPLPTGDVYQEPSGAQARTGVEAVW
jgi:hypothetical protein